MSGCGSGNRHRVSQSDGLYHINLESEIDRAKPANLTEIGSKITYIPLETNENSVLREHISRIRATDSHIALYCGNSEILMFDSSGKFISQIGKRGRGPGEYTNLTDFCFSTNGKKIHLLLREKIMEYDIEGKFINSFPLNAELFTSARLSLRMIPIDKNHLAIHQLNISREIQNSLIVTDLQNEPLKIYQNHFKLTSENPMPDYRIEPLYSYKDAVRFKQRGDGADTLFTVTQKELIPYAVFDLGKKSMPIDVSMSGANYDEILKNIGAAGKYFVREMSEDIDNIYFKLFDYRMLDGFTSRYLFGYFNKQGGNAKVIGEQRFQNNIDGGLPFYPEYIVNGEILVDLVQAFDLREHVLSGNATEMRRLYGKNYDDLVKLAKSLKDEDNQVIALVQK